MLYELYDIAITPAAASLLLGAILGLIFGATAWVSRFCLRRAVVAGAAEGRAAGGVWATALLTALLGTLAISAAGLVDLGAHRLNAAALPLLAAVLGGGLFGVGMVLTRGCISRLTVLGGAGNLRALTVAVVFAIVAHATMKGLLAPLRVAVTGVTVDVGAAANLSAWPGGAWLWGGALALALLAYVLRSGARPRDLALAAVIGLLVPAGWLGTGWLLFDEFDPIQLQSMSYTQPWTDGLFYAIAGTSVPAGFGTGLIGGTLLGAFLVAAAAGGLRLESFASPGETLRYVAGGAAMGFGAVLAGGCTLGAGLSGVSMLSLAAILALVSIIAAARVTQFALEGGAQAGNLAPAE